MMAIALASSPDEVRASALSRRTRTYDVNRHMYLRYTFVTVYCLDDGQVVDKHKHWMQAGGYPLFMRVNRIILDSTNCVWGPEMVFVIIQMWFVYCCNMNKNRNRYFDHRHHGHRLCFQCHYLVLFNTS